MRTRPYDPPERHENCSSTLGGNAPGAGRKFHGWFGSKTAEKGLS
jgi:hypothetical protein